MGRAGLILSLFLSWPAMADSLVLMGLSKHLHTQNWHQEKNWGVGYERDGYAAALYRNSENHPAAYFTKLLYLYGMSDEVDLGLSGGAAIGYRRCFFMPIIIPTVTIKVMKQARVDFGILPPIGKGPGLIGVQLRIQL